MTNYFNGINNSYNDKNVYAANKKPHAKLPFCGENTKKENKNLNEIPSVTNDLAVKVPLTYKKTGETNLPYGLKAHFYKLSNGQKVVILPKEGKTVLRSYVNTGSMNEPDNIRGISHYIEHNLFNGSDGLDAGEFFKTTDNIGADTNASTGMAETNYYIASNLLNSGDLEKEIKIHASMLETPKFAADMLEKEKGIVNSEINMITSNPDNIAYNITLKNLFNIKTSSNDVIAGTTDNITALTRDDVVNYFSKNYYPANIVTVVSGEVEPEETMKLLSKYFSSSKNPPSERHFEKLEPINNPVRKDIFSDKTKSPYLVMGFVGAENKNSKDRIYINALATLMFASSEAQKIFHPLNAGVSATDEKILPKPDAKRAIMLVSDVSEENSEKLLKEIYARIEKFQKVPVSDEDLKILKRDLKKEFTSMFESSFMINDFIGTSVLENRIDSVNDYEKIIEEMTPQDLMDAAKKYFDLNKTAITMLHPADTKNSQIIENYKNTNKTSFTGALKKQAININNVNQYNLQNNYRVITYDGNLPDIYADFLIQAKNPVTPKNAATLSVLNEMLDNGTMIHTKEEFLRMKEIDGVDTGIIAHNSGLLAEFSSDIGDYKKAYSIYKELIENPRFTQENFDKSVSDIKDRLSRSEKSAGNKLKPVLNKNKHTKEEILKGLETLKLEDVVNTYNELIQNSQCLVSVAAPFNTNKGLKNEVFSDLSKLKPAEQYDYRLRDDFEAITEPQVLTDTYNKSQANIIMAYKYKTSGNIKDAAALSLMNHILGGSPSSRLFNDLREKQKLAYSVNSNINTENTTGTIKLSIGTTTDNKETGEKSYDNVQKSINGFKTHIEKLKTEKISQEELNKAKLALKNNILSANERTRGKNLSLIKGGKNFYGPEYFNKILDVIDTITVDDIYNTAGHVFSGNPVYSIVATEDTLNYNKDYLKNLGKLN